MSNFRTLVVGATLAIASLGAFAQAASAPAATPRVDQRQANQQQRIDQGIASGALTPEVIRVDRNVYFCPGVTEYKPGYSYKTFAEWQQAGFDVNSVLADPLFVNAAQDDYRLKPESPALKLGFERADLGQVPSCKCRIEKLAPVFFESKPWPRGYR